MKAISLQLSCWALVVIGCGGTKVDVNKAAHDRDLGDTTFVKWPIDALKDNLNAPNVLSQDQCTNMTAPQVEGFAKPITGGDPVTPSVAFAQGPTPGQFILSWALCNKGRIAVPTGVTYNIEVHSLVTNRMLPPTTPPTDALFAQENVPMPAIEGCRCFVQGVGIQPVGGPNTVFQTVPNTLTTQANLQGLEYELPLFSLQVVPSTEAQTTRYEVRVPPEQGIMNESFPYENP